MSVNQSRGGDKNEFKRSGRSGNPNSPRNFPGVGGRGGGGGGGSSGTTTAPPSGTNYYPGNKSFKKVVGNNAQGAQNRGPGSNPNVNSNYSSGGGRGAPNGAHNQPSLRGTPDVSSTGAPAKLADASVQKSSPGLPKAPQSRAASHSSGTTDATGSTTPVKGSGDASRAFQLQFGSISPGVMNGMQVPARTNSAPPNLDEQKRAQTTVIDKLLSQVTPANALSQLPSGTIGKQARLDSLKAAASYQNQAAPKQHLPRKDIRPVDQPNVAEAPPTSRDKKEVLSSAPPVTVHSQKPTGPPVPSVPGVSMQMPFPQSQIHLPFGGPNPPLQSQPMVNTSLTVPLPMHISIGNPSQVPPQVFVPSIQHHQGIIHQSQGLTFPPQMGPQLGNMGIGMGLGPQYPQQSMGNLNFVGSRRTVKITHPDTHEELRLDKRTDGYLNGGTSGSRPHPHGPPQSQAVPSYPPSHPMNYYPSSYNPSPVYFPSHGGTQSTSGSQAPRFYNQPSKQVTVKPAVSHVEKVVGSSPSIEKSDVTKSQKAVAEGTSGQLHKDAETNAGSSLPQLEKSVVIKSQKADAEGTSGQPHKDSETNADSSLPQLEKSDITKSQKAVAEGTSGQPHKDSETSAGSSLPQLEKSDITKSQNAVAEGTSGQPHKDSETNAGSSLPQLEKSDITKSQKAVAEGTSGQPHKDSETSAGSSLPQLEKSDITKSQNAVAEGTSGQPHKDSETNAGSSLPQLEKSDITKSQKAVAEGTSGQPHKDSETSAGSSLPQLEKSDITKNQNAVAEGTFGQPHKDSETNAGSSLPQLGNLKDTVAAPTPVEDCMPPVNSLPEVAKETAVDRSRSLKEEQKQPGKEVFSVPVDKIGGQSSFVSSLSVRHLDSKDSGVQETSKPSTPSMETSNKVVPSNVADESVSRCESIEKGLDSTEIIGSGTHPDNPPKEGEPIAAAVVVPEEQVKDSADQNRDSTVSDATGAQQKEPVNDIDDKSSGSISTSDHGDQISNLDDHSNKFNGKDVDQINNPVTLNEESPAISLSVPDAPSASEVEATGSISPSSSKVKGNSSKARKKIKDILKNADARGTTSDLYNAYKRPEEKKETSSAFENPPVNSSEKEVLSDEKRGPTKFEPDDWEDAADISTPKMETGLKHHSEDDNEGMTKKYSRDFLLKFSDHCTDLPVGFEKTPEITEIMSVSGVNMVRDSYPSPGRGGDRAMPGPRLDRRSSNVGLDISWSKGPGTMAPIWDPRAEMNFPGRGVNHGVLRTPRGQPPGQYIGGILYGQMQSPGQLGIPMQRNNSDSDRWQRASNFQKGLIPSPHTPVMHKAERKYEVGKITDEEQAKQRQLKGILNKLTPQNFEKLFDQVKQVNIDNADTLSGVIGQIFDKALMEPTFVEMYANFCSRLSVELPDFSENDEKITFKRLLLNKCQEEFERGEREEEEANRTEEEGEVKQTEEEREEKRVKARRRMLGNIRLIGELYKKRMLTERIMHECIKKLLGISQTPDPDEENIEALCKLMSTIGEMIDHPKAKEHMDVYFDIMFKLSNNMDYSSRVRFMLKDAIDLRKNKWQQRRKVEGPKKIDEVHREAAQERQAQANRLARGPSSNPSTRRAQMDFGPKGSNVLPSNPQMGGYRGVPQQFRAYGNPDPRLDTFENRPLSVPLRPMGDDTITLGPQGGLARGMSVRGQPSMQGMPLHDMDSRRGVAGPNGYGSISERAGYGQEDLASRWFPRPVYDPSNIQEHNMNYVNRDMRNAGRGFVQVPPSSPPERARVTTPLPSGPSDKVMSEERLHDKSIETIKEFYSARDEKEVALCIRDLNAPSFYPSMISIWVIDSFERKDVDRESLTKLLINLAKSRDGILSQDSLVRGFECVLSTLEDAVNDAPKAAEFLGRIFAKVLLENVIPYTEVWRLIYEGGEEQGRLVEIGLAAEVLGVILEIIKSEKGDPFLNNMRMGSDLQLKNFRPPTIKKTLRLDKFI